MTKVFIFKGRKGLSEVFAFTFSSTGEGLPKASKKWLFFKEKHFSETDEAALIGIGLSPSKILKEIENKGYFLSTSKLNLTT